MIKLIQNALTVKKGSMNFMDQNGTVIGFNPRPDGNPLAFYVYGKNGDLVDTNGSFIEQYLDGIPYSFGKDGHIIKHKHGAGSDEDDKLVISLVPDDGGDPLELQIVCLNSLYYTANFTLSDKDRLIFRKPNAEAAAARDWQIAEINHAIEELVQAREQVSKALADLDLVKQKLLTKLA